MIRVWCIGLVAAGDGENAPVTLGGPGAAATVGLSGSERVLCVCEGERHTRKHRGKDASRLLLLPC